MFWSFVALAFIMAGIGLFGRIFFNLALISTIFLFLFAGLIFGMGFLILLLEMVV